MKNLLRRGVSGLLAIVFAFTLSVKCLSPKAYAITPAATLAAVSLASFCSGFCFSLGADVEDLAWSYLFDGTEEDYVCQKFGFICMMKPFKSRITMVQRMEDGGRDLVNDVAPGGLPKFYTIPRTADLTQTLGYKTEQIIAKHRDKETALAERRKERYNTNQPNREHDTHN